MRSFFDKHIISLIDKIKIKFSTINLFSYGLALGKDYFCQKHIL